MHRKASFKIFVTRREMLSVGDVPDHTLMLTEMEGEPIDYTPGVAGAFVSRRSVGFHDRTKGDGPMTGYATTIYENGAVYSKFRGDKMGAMTKGKWEVYKAIGKLSTLKGAGTFTVTPTDKPGAVQTGYGRRLYPLRTAGRMEKRRDKSGDFKTLDHPCPRSPVSLPDAGGKRPGVKIP